VKEVYPEMDMIFVGQNMEMRDLKVRLDKDQMAMLGIAKTDLYGELMSFKNEFAYRSLEKLIHH